MCEYSNRETGSNKAAIGRFLLEKERGKQVEEWEEGGNEEDEKRLTAKSIEILLLTHRGVKYSE